LAKIPKQIYLGFDRIGRKKWLFFTFFTFRLKRLIDWKVVSYLWTQKGPQSSRKIWPTSETFPLRHFHASLLSGFLILHVIIFLSHLLIRKRAHTRWREKPTHSATKAQCVLIRPHQNLAFLKLSLTNVSFYKFMYDWNYDIWQLCKLDMYTTCHDITQLCTRHANMTFHDCNHF